MLSWQIGAIKITRIVELETSVPANSLLPSATQEGMATIPWLRPHFVDDDDNLNISIHALVVETPDSLIVVDTCVGNDKDRDSPLMHRLQTGFMESFARAGYRPEDVQVVLCTHLHVDHVGWNTHWVDGRWLPTFPHARYLLGRKEVAHWRHQMEAGESNAPFLDSVQPLFDAGLVDLVDTAHCVCEGVELVATPGHTPGHVSVLISSRGHSALITGDMIHHPVQLARPEWASFIDTDADQGVHTRKEVFSRLEDSSVLLVGTHFATPTAGYVVAEDGAWRLEMEDSTAPHSTTSGVEKDPK